MAKTVSVSGSGVLLALLAKALTSKSGGVEIGARANITETGDFAHEGRLNYRLVGKVGEDFSGDRFYGVELNTVIDLLIGALGCTENALRRILSIAVELRRAELEDRKVGEVAYTLEDGTPAIVTVEQIAGLQASVTERKARLASEVARFSQLIKTSVPIKGQVTFSHVGMEVEGAETTVRVG